MGEAREMLTSLGVTVYICQDETSKAVSAWRKLTLLFLRDFF